MKESALNRAKYTSCNWRIGLKMEVSEEDFLGGQNKRLIGFPKSLHFLANTNVRVVSVWDKMFMGVGMAGSRTSAEVCSGH